MPRTARLSAPFRYYHILNRGIGRKAIFRDIDDYLRFLEKLAETKSKFDWIIYSYSLLPNHYHLQTKIRKSPLSKIMQSLQTSHSGYFNRKYRHVGPVFQGRFKSIIVQKGSYFIQLSKYIHLNPIEANLVNHPLNYPYSSYSEYLNQPKHQYKIIDKRAVKMIIGSLSKHNIQQYREFVEEDDKLEYYPQKAVRGIIGSKEFINQFEKRKNQS